MRCTSFLLRLGVLFGSVSVAAGCSSTSSEPARVYCTEFHVGSQVDPRIAPHAGALVVEAQSIADVAAAAQAQIADLTSACKALAVSLGAPSSSPMAGDGGAVGDDAAKAWCQIAVDAISATRASAGGSLSLVTTPPACKLDVATKLACQARCAGTTSCDATAHPIACNGGTLADGSCIGGKLVGGCVVAALCDHSCDASLAAFAECPKPAAVTVTTTGATDASKAAMLQAALEAGLPSVLALNAQLELESAFDTYVAGYEDVVRDMKAACIIPVLSAATVAASSIDAGVTASSSVLRSVQ